MTLAHSNLETQAEEVEIKSDSEDFDSNESVQDSDSVKSEVESEEESQINTNSNSEESSKESEESEDDFDPNKNKAWADSVSKILKTNKPKGKKTLVLSKAKKLTDVKREKPKEVSFQIDGEVKEEKPDPLELLDKVKEENDEPARKKRKEIVSVRVKPSTSDRECERALSKIATRGVVQLFNAVRAQQKDITNRLEEAGPLERNKDKALRSIDKRQFLDVLMGGEQARSESVGGEVKDERRKGVAEKDTPTWGVLRDDFMLSAKFKDWDKEQEDDNDAIDDL